MSMSYLAIENDIDFYERESAFWGTRNINSIRVSSMLEGIKEAATKQFAYIGINASNIEDYQTKLSYLRKATTAPILISTNVYCQKEHSKTTELGADLYGKVFEDSIDNFRSVTAIMSRVGNIASQRQYPFKFLSCGDIFMIHSQRQVFVDDVYVDLTTQDYDLLHLFIDNRGYVFSYEELYNTIWKSEYDESAITVIKNAIKRLRQKININECNTNVIQNSWNHGYMCPDILVSKPQET